MGIKNNDTLLFQKHFESVFYNVTTAYQMLPLIAEFSYEEEPLKETGELACDLAFSTTVFLREEMNLAFELGEWESIRLGYMTDADINIDKMVPDQRYGDRQGMNQSIDYSIASDAEEMFFSMYWEIRHATAQWCVDIEDLCKTITDNDCGGTTPTLSIRTMISDECERFHRSISEERKEFISKYGLSAYAKQLICENVNAKICSMYQLVGIDRIHRYLLDDDLSRFYKENPDASPSYKNILQSFKSMITPLYEKLFYWLYYRRHLRMIREITNRTKDTNFKEKLLQYLYLDTNPSVKYFTLTQVFEPGETTTDIATIEERVQQHLQEDIDELSSQNRNKLKVFQPWAVYLLRL